ncbi:dihydrolipoyl dehydrogenase family protein [Raoultibacter phocaeensis]|uniref:dihydrolipoyl dehydrogenase family protein n=1 Tax=Raoultibacter phocaeensis TaxID=2479841 RepID=UPI00111AB105|nr:NAD(P)/FAD-dependent oxidoreductase [Raoultibacter phocaeensis]
MKHYDVVVIGSGPGGSAAAYALKDGGKSVALVEEDLWGGTCPNRGCDPKKMLVSGLEAVERTNQLAGKGFDPIESIAWPDLMAFKRTFTEPFPRSFKEGAEEAGIDALEGSARFVDEGRIEVAGETIEADAFVIATGQRPSILDIEGKEYLATSTDFLDMDTLPETMTFLGGGYVSFELASIANAAGSKVTIVHHNDRPLKGFDADLVSDLVKALEDRGVEFAFDVDVKRIAKTENGFALEADGYSAQSACVVGATGRIPNVEHLGLENAHIDYDKHGIVVDDHLRTANERVFACGDVLSKREPKLTPVASFEGRYVAQQILGNSTDSLSYPPMVSVVYASPKVAQAGVSTKEAEQNPDRYKVKSVDVTGWFTYRRLNDPVAYVKLVFEGDRLVGAAALNSQADELINLFALLIDRGIGHDDLDRMIFGYPTIASDLSSFV